MARTEGSRNVCGTLFPHSCHWCGKKFYGDTDLWAYKANLRIAENKRCDDHIFCSWSCLCAARRKAQRIHADVIAAKREKRKQKKAQEGG